MERIFTLPWVATKGDSLEVKLAKKAIKGNEEALIELMKLNKVSLYKIAYSYVKDEDKALEILQEATYKGLLGIGKLKNPEFFKTWITRIVINTAINITRKDSKITYLSDDSPLIYKEVALPIDEKIDLYNAIDKLRDKYKTVIILKYFDGMSIEEIAYVMDIPENTVKSHLRRAKEALSKSLREGYLDD